MAPRLVKIRRPAKKMPRLLSEYQVRQLIAATQTLRDRALIEFFYGTGCRMNETLLLRVEDLDLDGRRARVVESSEERGLYCSRRVQRSLYAHT